MARADDLGGPRGIRGAGGSKKGGSGSGSSTSAPDTLFSTATVRLVDLLGEGEIKGVRGGLKGIYLNDTPVQNADGSLNFQGLTAEFRTGTPDQPYMEGYPDVQAGQQVGVKVNQPTPVTASITDPDVDRVRVTVEIPSLFLAKNDGSVSYNSLVYRVEARYSGGPWVNLIGDQTIYGKASSPYYRSHEFALPTNPSGASPPWQVRVTRLSPDTDGFNNSQSKYTNQSDLFFYSATAITDAKFSYPHSAAVGITALASSFGSSMPGRTYLVDGIAMKVPSNYDPVARTYSGLWDGTFKEAFDCSCPAWVLSGAVRNLPERASTSADFDDAEPGEWTFVVTAKGLNGQFSGPATLVYVAHGWAGTDAPVVANLRVKETNGTTFINRSCTVVWSHTFPDGREPYPVENVVTVLDPASGALIHSQRLQAGQTEWTYAYDLNVSEGGPRRSFRVTVGALTPDGRESGHASIVVMNPAPGVPASSVQTLPETLFLLITPPTDADLAGYLVWASPTSGFMPGPATLIADGPGTSVVRKLGPGNWHLRLAAYDGFGKTGLNVSGETAVAIGLGSTPDFAQTPALPGAPTYSTSLARLADGTTRTSVVLDWPASTDGLTAAYALEIREGAGNWVQRYNGVDPHAEIFGLLPGAAFQARVRAISRFGVPSAGYSPVLSGTVAANTTPPGPATGLTAQAGFQAVTLAWTNPADADLDVVEVWAASSADLSAAAKIGEVDGNRFWHTGLAAGTARSYWVRPRNSSGITAATFAPNTTAGVTATTAFVQAVDLADQAVTKNKLADGIVDATKIASSIQPITVAASIPGAKSTDFVTVGGVLYQWKGTAYLPAIDAANLSGQIGPTQITDTAITTAKLNVNDIFGNAAVLNKITAGVLVADAIKANMLDVGVVTSRSMGVGISTNQLFNSDFLIQSGPFYVGGYTNAPYDSVSTIDGASYTGFYTPLGMRTLRIYRASAVAAGQVVDVVVGRPSPTGTGFTHLYPVEPSSRYELSVYLTAHSCRGYCFVAFVDANGAVISASVSSVDTNSATYLRSLDPARRVGAFVTSPPNAVAAQFCIRLESTGAAQSYVFATAPLFGKAKANQTEYSDWSPGSGTLIDGSGVRANSIYGTAIRAGQIDANHVAAGELITLSAQIRNAIIDDAKITNLSASKLVAGTVIPGTVLMGASFGSFTSEQILDVLTRLPDYVNAGFGPGGVNRSGTTLIQPGRVFVSGANTLDSYFDATFIKGGMLRTNSVGADKLTISARGITSIDLAFEAHPTVSRTVRWESGYILWVQDSGVPGASLVAAGSYTMGPGSYAYIYWRKDMPDAGLFGGTDNWPAIMADQSCVIVCGYDGGTGINTGVGGVVINGGRISAGTIATVNFTANTIDGNIITANTLAVEKLAAGTIQTLGPIYLGGAAIELNPQAQAIITRYPNGIEASRQDGSGFTLRAQNNTILLQTLSGATGLSGGANLLPNSDCMGGTTNLSFSYNGVLPFSSGTSSRNFGGAYSPPGMDAAAAWFQPTDGGQIMDIAVGSVRSNGATFDDRIPVAAGAWFEASAYVAGHRCTTYVVVSCHNYLGDALAYPNWSQTGAVGGSFLSQYARIGGVFQAPPGTEYVRFLVRATAFSDGSQFAYLFATGFMLAPAIAGQSNLTPYTPGPSKDRITPSTIGTYIETLTVDTIYVKNGALSTVAAVDGLAARNLPAWTDMVGTGAFVCKGGNLLINAAVTIFDGGEYQGAGNGSGATVRGFDVLLDGIVVGTMVVWDAVNTVAAAGAAVFNFYWGGQSVASSYKAVVGAGSHAVSIRVRDGGNWKSRATITVVELAK